MSAFEKMQKDDLRSLKPLFQSRHCLVGYKKKRQELCLETHPVCKESADFYTTPIDLNYVCLYVDIHWIRLDRLRCESILHEVTE